MLEIILVVGVLGAFLLYFVMIYNRLIALKNQTSNALSQIDVQLKRRHDLIPNLVEIAKKYMGHEAHSLIAVTEARNQAKACQDKTHGLEDVSQIRAIAQAEGVLSKALGNFYAVVESYPELKADGLMKQVMDELTNTENRIGFARQHYNDSVMFYNNQRETFPNNLVSGFFMFEKAYELQFADKENIQIAPSLHFD